MHLKRTLQLALAGFLFMALTPAYAAAPLPLDASFFGFLTPKVTPLQLKQLSDLPAFEVGPKTGPIVDILFIPGCPHCKALWNQIQVLRHTNGRANTYLYRWIPLLVSPNDAQRLLPYWSGLKNSKALTGLMTTGDSVKITKVSAEAKSLQLSLRPSLVWLQATGAQIAPALVVVNQVNPQLRLGNPSPETLQKWLALNVK